jgi:hypothetical protein
MAYIKYTKEKIVAEDLETGIGTVAQSRGTMTQINGDNIPYDSANSINDKIDTKADTAYVDSEIATREPLGGDATTTFKKFADKISAIGGLEATYDEQTNTFAVNSLIPGQMFNIGMISQSGTKAQFTVTRSTILNFLLLYLSYRP